MTTVYVVSLQLQISFIAQNICPSPRHAQSSTIKEIGSLNNSNRFPLARRNDRAPARKRQRLCPVEEELDQSPGSVTLGVAASPTNRAGPGISDPYTYRSSETGPYWTAAWVEEALNPMPMTQAGRWKIGLGCEHSSMWLYLMHECFPPIIEWQSKVFIQGRYIIFSAMQALQ